MILAPNEMKAEPDERKSAKVCLETIQLDPELYRIGHTKARSQLENFRIKSTVQPFYPNPPLFILMASLPIPFYIFNFKLILKKKS